MEMHLSKGQRATHDVIIVGAGLAGCTAALLFARQGISVALIERQASLDDHKPLCTHYLHPGAIPILRGLGIYDMVPVAALDKALQRYRLRHWMRFAPQFFLITRFSRAKRFNVITRGLLRLITKGNGQRGCKSGGPNPTP